MSHGRHLLNPRKASESFFGLSAWEDEVEDDGQEEDDGYAVLGEDGLDNLGEDGKHA